MTLVHRVTPAAAVLSMVLLNTLFWGESKPVLAAEIPEQLSLLGNDTVRIIEHSELKNWFRVGQAPVFDPRYTAEIETPHAPCARKPDFCHSFVPRSLLAHFIARETFTLQRDVATQAISILFDELERDPINAKLTLDTDGKLIVAAEAVPGLEVKRDASLSYVLSILEQNTQTTLSVALEAQSVPAKISRETVSELRLDTKLSEGKTNFRGSPKNRIYNIHRAIEQYDGIVIGPDEEFSFVHYLGEVDGEHGYLPELVIKHNKTEPEFGGGICQVSTTVFRAAILAGLEITERKNHAYPVQYYRPYGMDATIYIPRPDLKFKNNTPGSILMIPKIVGTELTITLFGTSDGRTTTIDGPHILESNPDGSMRTIFTQTVKDVSGNVMVNETFPSNYKSPHLFPHPGEEVLTEKPKNWSSRQWKEYKALRS